MSTRMKALSFKGEKPKKKKRKHHDGPPSFSSKRTRQESDDEIGPDQEPGWMCPESVEQINGPLLIAFPTKQPTTLTADPTGSIFTSPLPLPIAAPLSIPQYLSRHAQPAEVRQVFIATRVPYTSTTGTKVRALNESAEGATVKIRFTLRSAQGKYLGASKSGFLAADGEAIGPEEEWEVIKLEDDTIDEEIKVQDDSDDDYGPQPPSPAEDEGGALTIHDSDDDTPRRKAASPTTKILTVRPPGDTPKPPMYAFRTHRGQFLTLPSSTSTIPSANGDEPYPLILRMQSVHLPSAPKLSSHSTAGTVVEMSSKLTRADYVRMAGRELEDAELKKLKKAQKEGNVNEVLLDLRKGMKRDKFAW